MSKTEYHIYKLFSRQDGGPQMWDGPFTSLKEARKVFKRDYAPEGRGRPAFAIYRITAERLD